MYLLLIHTVKKEGEVLIMDPKFIFIFILSLEFALFIGLPGFGQDELFQADQSNNISETGNNLSGLVYINDLHLLTLEQYNRILECNEIKYILTQAILYPGIFSQSMLERDRIVEMAHAGKRVVLQIWFGPGSYYNWSYCGYPNIAMQQEVRDYIFPLIDNVIDQIGPEHIYGIHIFEEDGYFGVDIDEPGHWWMNRGKLVSGNEDNDPYSNYVNLRKLYGGLSAWSPLVPNIAQYHPEFKIETGLDMHNLPNDPLAYPVLDRWMARCLWAGAHREFLQHIRAKYPTIKRFVWGSLAYPWNGTAMDALRDTIDGVIADPYTDTLAMHHSLSGLMAMLPDAELLALLMGSQNKDEKCIRAATAYLSGASAIGYFKTLYDYICWNTSVEIWRSISELPIINPARSKVLIVSGNTDNGYSTSKVMLPFFKMPVALPERDAAGISLSGYEIIVLHACTSFKNDLSLSRYNMTGYGPDDQSLKNWVASGGILVITAPIFLRNSLFFVPEESIAWTENYWESAWNRPVEFSCRSDIAAKYHINSTYILMAGVRRLLWGNGIAYDQLPIGGVTRYGQGWIVILPAFHRDKVLMDKFYLDEDRNRWQKEMAYYIADVVRGVAMLRDPSGILAREICSQGELFGLSYEDNEIYVKTVFDKFGQPFSSEIYKAGELILGSTAGE